MTEPAGAYDVIVIGGGPAGSTAATLVARESRRVLLLDRESFPRFRVGESLMPATYWTLKRLGLLERMKASHFPRKHSVQFFSSNGKHSHPFYFSEVDQHESSATWQVDRGEFDAMLLDNAAAAGVEIRQQAQVKEVLFDGAVATGVVLEQAEGGTREIRARVVVDATGQRSMLARQLKLRRTDPKLRHLSYFTRYRGAHRDEGIDEGATLILRTDNDEAWFWYIPLPGDLVSVGVVGPTDYLSRGRSSVPRQVYDEEVARCAELRRRIEGATQVADVGVLRDFSYISRQIAGDGWVIAGDAFGFLDPIYSTGVFLALTSGELAADSINASFDEQDFSGKSLGRHGDRYLAGMESLRKLVYAYYDPDFSVPRFLKRHPEYRRDVVNLLIGNVFREPVDGLFEAMGEECELPASRMLEPLGERR